MKVDKTKIKYNLFGIKYYYLNDNTRIRYGFSIINAGITYSLQRKEQYNTSLFSVTIWKTTAWDYKSSIHEDRFVTFDELLSRLDIHERYQQEEKDRKKTLF